MSSVICPPKNHRRHQDAVTIMHPIKRKLMAPYLKSSTSSEDDQPLDFSTKKTATPCQDSELRQSTDIPSPAIADHPTQAVRHHSPEESVLNSMRFRDSSASSPESLPPTPPSSQSLSSTPRSSSSPNGVLTNGVPAMFEGISLSSQNTQRFLPHPHFPYPMAAFMPASQQFLSVDTSTVNGLNGGSPIAIGTTITGDSKLVHSPGIYPHFASLRGNVPTESLNGLGMNNIDPSMASLLAVTDKKGAKPGRPFKSYSNDTLPFPFPSTMPDMLPYGVTSSRDQELRFAQYTEQFMPVKRRPSNGHQTKGDSTAESKPTTVDNISQMVESNQTDSNSDSSDGSPVNGNGQPAVTSTGPSTSEQGPKRKNRALPDELKDEAYWERRRKNNEAAKRSRDARRAKEDEIAMRCSFLQNENLKLRAENEALRLHLRNLTAHMSR